MSSATDWRLDESAGVLVVRCAALARIPGVRHGFSTLAGSGDLGAHDDPRRDVAERRALFLGACGLAGRWPTLLHQLHGSTILDAGALERGAQGLAGDGAVSVAGDRGTGVPAIRWADCVPLLLATRNGAAVAAVHAGWRGLAAGVVGAALGRLRSRGSAPGSLVAALGPAIGACCYEVGDAVATAVARAAGTAAERLARRRGDRLALDLRLAARLQLEQSGVPADAIHVAPWCTRCDAELFDSYRRQGAAAGRQMACIGRAEAQAP